MDFRKNMSVDWNSIGKYATDIFTEEAVNTIKSHDSENQPLFLYLSHLAVHSANAGDPLQAPEENIKIFNYIEDKNRRKYAAMIHKLDESVGIVVEALMEKKMLKDSVIVFSTDNGGAANGFNLNAGSNWPLKGVCIPLCIKKFESL